VGSVANDVPMRLASKRLINITMSYVKLFRLKVRQATELAGLAVRIEKSLQQLFQTNIEAVLS
jgi:hypothetical protein